MWQTRLFWVRQQQDSAGLFDKNNRRACEAFPGDVGADGGGPHHDGSEHR
jgi:hypothetical protein